MATPHTKGGASAPPAFDVAATVGQRVVRLPTAARRQVQQPCNKAGREARRAFKAAHPWPGEHIFPCHRDAMRGIRELRARPTTPAVSLARAIIDAREPGMSKAIMQIIDVSAKAGEPVAVEVMAILTTVIGETVGAQSDFLWARARMAEEAFGLID